MTKAYLFDLQNATDDERESLVWLVMANKLDGKQCVYCGHTFQSRQDVIDRRPVQGWKPDEVACKACWDKENGDELD